MRVLMLGWEFPPYLTGGLGTACDGLTRALRAAGAEIIFVLPRPIPRDARSHVQLRAPEAVLHSPLRGGWNGLARGKFTPSASASAIGEPHVDGQDDGRSFLDARTEHASPTAGQFVLREVAMRFVSPYGGGAASGIDQPPFVYDPNNPDAPLPQISHLRGSYAPTYPAQMPSASSAGSASAEGPQAAAAGPSLPTGGPASYRGDLILEARRYARICVDLALHEQFDVIHAHDWLTFPAGQAVAAATGKPLVVHIHSTEFDRSPDNPDARICQIEKQGVLSARRVIAVSRLTAAMLQRRYGVPAERIDLVYNGVEDDRPELDFMRRAVIRPGEKIVLFLGRVTRQKGPEYFLRAAKKVLEKQAHVRFIIAGAGDQIQPMVELAAAEGIGGRVHFTGFLSPSDVQRVLDMADVYVMPSVSEPFGIAPLEAISHDVPVIISKTSGVAEVLTHALKVDFWDVQDIADKILAVLRHPSLAATLRQNAETEVRGLTWEAAARKCLLIYQRLMNAVSTPAALPRLAR